MDYYDLIPLGSGLKAGDEFKSFKVEPMVLHPRMWAEYPNRLSLTWNMVKFDVSQLENVPDDVGGVYSFVAIPEIANHISCSYMFYVGKTDRTFRERYKEYLRGQRTGKIEFHKYEMLVKWRDYLWFCYAPINDTNMIKQLEDDLIGAYIPPFNKEYPAKIRDIMKVLR
ncbi:MAG: hypothetical protein Fur0044_00910 [Anaerolineae bacterium]